MSYNNGPRIVTNGLVLYLDAGNRKSYPGTGTSWFDLRGNNNGSIENSPIYSSANNGFFTFNGTTQRVNCGNSSSLQITSGSIAAWFNADSNNSGFRGIIAKQNAWGLFVSNNTLVTYSWGAPAGTKSTNITVGNNTWNYVVMTFTETIGVPSNNAIIYLNGNPVLTTTIAHVSNSIPVYVGEANANQFFSGRISNASIYNIVLSPIEIVQNYSAIKSRYNS